MGSIPWEDVLERRTERRLMYFFEDYEKEVEYFTLLCCKYGTDKVDLNYTPFYVSHFRNIRNEIKSVLEIGISGGNSLRVWRDYFPNALIYGIDCDNKYIFNEERIKTFKADQSNREHLVPLMRQIGEVDIIIDDGGHTMQQQQISLGCLFPFVKGGGYYIIEDLSTSMMSVKEFNLTETPETTLTLLKKLSHKEGVKSDFITQGEIDYLVNNSKSCEIEVGRTANRKEVKNWGYFYTGLGFIKKC
jgi:hypothetical protein